MEQIAGETSLRLFARARDVQAAATILHALWTCKAEVDFIKPAAIVLVSSGAPGAETIAVDVYGDGSAFKAVTAELIPTDRIYKRELEAWCVESGESLKTAIAGIVANLEAGAELEAAGGAS